MQNQTPLLALKDNHFQRQILEWRQCSVDLSQLAVHRSAQKGFPPARLLIIQSRYEQRYRVLVGFGSANRDGEYSTVFGSITELMGNKVE
jgi:hypothetical protein